MWLRRVSCSSYREASGHVSYQGYILSLAHISTSYQYVSSFLLFTYDLL